MRTIQQLLTKHLDIWTSADTEKKISRGRSASNTNNVYGIKKLRELILGLAISGKLLPQDSNDTPTSVVATKIGIKKKKINEVLLKEFFIPESWEWYYISDLCDLKTGATPSTTRSDYYGGSIRWLVSGDINKNEIYDCEGRITEAGLNNSNCKLLPKNSVLIALNGQGKTRATVAILRVEAVCNQSLVAMIPKYQDLILPEFIKLNLRYRYFEIRDITGQNQRRGLNMGLISKLSISVPPLAEQSRILAKVDELMTLCDQLETKHNNSVEAHEKVVNHLLNTLTLSQNAEDINENWQRILEHFDILFNTESSIDALKQTILQLAVKGKLVTQDPNDEPANKLYKRIQAEKARLISEGKIKMDKPLLPITAEEKLFILPSGWEWYRLQDVLDVRDGTHDSPKEAVSEATYPLVTSKDFFNGEINFDTAKKISEADHLEISKRSRVEKYDILFSMIGGNIGNQVMVNDDRPFSIKNVALFKYYNKSLISPFFIKKYLENLAVNLQSSAVGGAQPFIALGVLRNLVIALPPLSEQQRIVSKIDELFVFCDHLIALIIKANQWKKKLADVMINQVLK